MQKNNNTIFFNRVITIVSQIPRGTTLSYAEVAIAAGSPHACRAVGTIMAKNYNPSVPCHRVIRTDGSLGAYNRGGTEQKKKLLESEGVYVKQQGNKYIVSTI